VNCYFSSSFWPNNPSSAGQQCVDEIFGDLWPTIDVCARTKVGEELYARLQDKVDALLPPLTYTPWITINGKHSRAAELHLTRAVCDAYTVRNPQFIGFYVEFN
jgi:interferon gamma-inducible protein 30